MYSAAQTGQQIVHGCYGFIIRKTDWEVQSVFYFSLNILWLLSSVWRAKAPFYLSDSGNIFIAARKKAEETRYFSVNAARMISPSGGSSFKKPVCAQSSRIAVSLPMLPPHTASGSSSAQNGIISDSIRRNREN